MKETYVDKKEREDLPRFSWLWMMLELEKMVVRVMVRCPPIMATIGEDKLKCKIEEEKGRKLYLYYPPMAWIKSLSLHLLTCGKHP